MTKEQKQLGKTLWGSIAKMARQQNDKLKTKGITEGHGSRHDRGGMAQGMTEGIAQGMTEGAWLKELKVY